MGLQAALEAYAQRMIAQHDLEHSFYVMDLGVVVSCSPIRWSEVHCMGPHAAGTEGTLPEGEQTASKGARDSCSRAGVWGTALVGHCSSIIWRAACMSWG